MRLRTVPRSRGRLVVCLALLFSLAPAGAHAATQTRDDPSDAPAGASGEADLRSLSWDVAGSSGTLTVSIEDSTFGGGQRADIGIHVLLDTDADGIADRDIVATRNADGSKVDLDLVNLDGVGSTADCQELGGKTSGQTATVAPTVAGGLETFVFKFDPTVVPGGLASFRWAVFGQAPPGDASAGPWDVMPDAADPNSKAPNPGERHCGPGKTGVSVRMADGVAFPDATDPTPTPTTAPGPSGPTKPVVVLALPGGQPQAGAPATIDAKGTVPPAGTHIIAYQWDIDSDGQIDTNTGTNPVIHLPTTTATVTVTVTALDSNRGVGSGTIIVDPGLSPQHCDAEASIGILRITAACITRSGSVTTASGTPSNRYWENYVVELNGISLVTRDPRATVTFDESSEEIVGHGDFRVMSLNAPGGDITWYETGEDGFHWPLPSGTRGVPRMASLGVAQDCDDDSDATKCFEVPGGFPVTGQIGVGIDTGTLDAVLDVQVSVESGIRVTTGVRLRMNIALGGIRLDTLRFRIDNASFGVLTLERLSFVYQPPGAVVDSEGDRWDVQMSIEIPTPHIAVAGRMIFENGPLVFAGAEVGFDPGILVYAGIFLNHFGAHFGIDPIRLGGLIGASLFSVLQVDAGWAYLARRDGTIAFRLNGTAGIVDGGGQLANFQMEFWNDGYASYSGRIGYGFPSDDPTFELFGQTEYWAEPDGDQARYQGHGQLAVTFHSIQIASADIYINNDFAAGCGFGYRGSHGYHSSARDVLQIVLAHCDVAEFLIQPTRPHDGILPPDALAARSLESRAAPALAAPEGRAFTVAAGERALAIQVEGVGGAPQLVLADPKGRTYRATIRPDTERPVVDGDFSSAYLTKGGITLLRVEKPVAGEWTLTPLPGSPAIDTVTRGKVLAPLKISARVRGSGRKRRLTWRAPRLEGRTIRFTERGANVGQTIVVTKKSRGSAKWTIQEGSAGKRRIEAQVTSSTGIPIATPVVARYKAPGPPRPGRPGRLKIRRRGETVKIGWPRMKHVDGYRVRVTGSDGRREVFFPARRRPHVKTLRVAPTTRLKVRVAGFAGTHLITGPARTGKLRVRR